MLHFARSARVIRSLLAFCFIPLLIGISFGAEKSGASPPHWSNTYNVRSWFGFKDNVLLGRNAAMESPFIAGGLDALLWRLPVNGWEYLFLATGDYIRYLPGEEVNKEVTLIAQAQIKKHFAESWTGGTGFEYIYFDQVFDNSTLERDLASIQVQAHGLTLRPSVRKEFKKNWLELELPLSRQDFKEIIDDYWEGGPKVTWARQYGGKSEFSLSYELNNRFHDTREIRSADGSRVPGTHLEFLQHEIAAGVRHHWDQAQHWRTVTRAKLERNQDNGSGYYDYWRPQLSQQIRFQTKTWQVKTEAKISYYHYDFQPISETDSSARRKTNLLLGLRGERTLFNSLKVFAEYEHDRSISNLDFDGYKANTIMAGVDWEF
jgi:hypothetical protein